MPKDLNILILNSEALKLSVEDLVDEINVPVNYDIVDMSNKENIRKILPNYNVLVSTSLDISMKNESKNLKAIFMPGAGWDKISAEAVPEGCVVTNSYEHENAIAEYVIMSMIALDRELINAHNNFSENKWDYFPARFGPFNELSGRNVVAIGLGRIGKKVLEYTKVFGMNNFAVEEQEINKKVIKELNINEIYKPNEMTKIISKSDFVIVCVPYIKSTKGLIGEKEIYSMKNDAFIINPARGPIIQEEHLYHALKSNRIAGACLDTWYTYPKSDSDEPSASKFNFGELKNVIITPHVCGSTYGTFSRRMKIVGQNINNYYNDKKLINVVDDLSKI